MTPRVASVHGDEALLALTEPLPPDAGFLPAPAQLSFDHDGHLIMLTGMLYLEDGNALRFVVADGVRQSDKRQHVRLAVRLPALATPLDAAGRTTPGPPLTCRTVDVSAGGTLLDCGGLSGAVRVAIELPGTAGTVQAQGQVARGTSAVTAVLLHAGPARRPGAARALRDDDPPRARPALRRGRRLTPCPGETRPTLLP